MATASHTPLSFVTEVGLSPLRFATPILGFAAYWSQESNKLSAVAKTKKGHQVNASKDEIIQTYTNCQPSAPTVAPSSQALAMDMKNVWDGLAKYLRGDNLNIDLFRIVMEEVGGLGTEPIDVTYEEVQCPGTVRPAIWCKPLHASPSRVILYLHGGAFMAGSPASHRRTAGHLASMVSTLR